MSDTVAVALYYAEGSADPVGAAAMPHYLTRMLEVYVKEGDTWKVRTTHASPLTGGAGWTLTTPNDDSR